MPFLWLDKSQWPFLFFNGVARSHSPYPIFGVNNDDDDVNKGHRSSLIIRSMSRPKDMLMPYDGFTQQLCL